MTVTTFFSALLTNGGLGEGIGKGIKKKIFTFCNLLCDQKIVSCLPVVQGVNHSWFAFHLNIAIYIISSVIHAFLLVIYWRTDVLMTSSLKLFFPYILILYYIKEMDSMLPCVCSVIDHRGRQNVVRTKKWHTRRSHSNLESIC